jgi:hypothetical protein
VFSVLVEMTKRRAEEGRIKKRKTNLRLNRLIRLCESQWLHVDLLLLASRLPDKLLS